VPTPTVKLQVFVYMGIIILVWNKKDGLSGILPQTILVAQTIGRKKSLNEMHVYSVSRFC